MTLPGNSTRTNAWSSFAICSRILIPPLWQADCLWKISSRNSVMHATCSSDGGKSFSCNMWSISISLMWGGGEFHHNNTEHAHTLTLTLVLCMSELACSSAALSSFNPRLQIVHIQSHLLSPNCTIEELNFKTAWHPGLHQEDNTGHGHLPTILDHHFNIHI